MTAAEHKSDFELIKRPYITCKLWGVCCEDLGKNYISLVIISSDCIWIFVKHNSLRPNDTSVSYIIIGWDNGLSLARCQGHYLNHLYPRRIANLTRGTNGLSSNLKPPIFNKENVNTYNNVVCEMSTVWARPQSLISWCDLETLYILCTLLLCVQNCFITWLAWLSL